MQAVEEVRNGCDVLAFVDGDALPHRWWLRDLVIPLSDPSVGVTTGNRWYAPQTATWGSLVRYFWNAGAIVQVWMNGICWAGSMAMRSDVVHRTGLVKAWSRALSVDATVTRKMREHGYRVQFVPGVMLVNTETISLGKFVRWVQRQLIAAKSSRAGWPMVALQTFALTAIQAVCLVLTAWGAATGRWDVAGVSGAALAGFWMTSLVTALAIELSVRRLVRGYGENCRWLGPAAWSRLLPAIALTYLVFPGVFLGATFRRRVAWRGIQYEILGAKTIRMVAYQPIRLGPDVDANASVV
jgi:hypothetical protein